jgi:hypothetical protein
VREGALTDTDLNGRSYARLSELKAGDKIQIDGDFTCIEPWGLRTVKQSYGRLYIACSQGGHNLDGQLNDDGYLVGVYCMTDKQ